MIADGRDVNSQVQCIPLTTKYTYVSLPSSELLAELFEGRGFRSVANDYVFRETVNKKEGLCVQRVFLQSKFTKTHQTETSP